MQRQRFYMDILLQNKNTLRFLDHGSGWTRERAQARIFGTGLEAIFFHSRPIAMRVFPIKNALAFARFRATRHGHEKQNQETKANEV